MHRPQQIQNSDSLLTRNRRLERMLRWTSQVVCRYWTTVRKRPMTGISLDQQPARGLLDRPWMSTGSRTWLSLYSGWSSLSERSATSRCWWCCCGVEVHRRSERSSSSGPWPSPTLDSCSAPSGSRLTTRCRKVGRSESSLASYSTCGNGQRWTVPYGLWRLCQLIGIKCAGVLLSISSNSLYTVSQKSLCQILFGLVYSWESYHKNNKKLIRRWDSEGELPLRTTSYTKYKIQ